MVLLRILIFSAIAKLIPKMLEISLVMFKPPKEIAER